MTPENLRDKSGPAKTLFVGTTPQFVVWQSLLTTRLGISIEEVRARRDLYLKEGVDWQKIGQRILLTTEAEAVLLKTLNVPLPANAMAPPRTPEETAPAPATPEKNAAQIDAQAPEEKRRLVVARSAPHIRNRHIVETVLEGMDTEDRANVVLLWVKDNAKFRVGHVIPREHVEPRQSGQFTYVAGRAPK